MLRELINGMPDFTGGGKGMNLPILHMSVGAEAQFFFYAMLTLAVVLMPRGLADVFQQFHKTGWRYFLNNIRAHRI
jgi:branched-chain amino acid transport system permease protein